MDGERFDALSRGVWTSSSRRRLIGLAASLPLAGLLAERIGNDSAEARSQRKRRRRKRSLKASRCRGLNEICGALIGDPCCAGTVCLPSAVGVVATCQLPCLGQPDNFCEKALNGSKDVTCSFDPVTCSLYFSAGTCCKSKHCESNTECASGICCKSRLSGVQTCCMPGQRCGDNLGCEANIS